MARLVVLGAGFAGLWAAIGAARRLDDGEAAEILVIDRNPITTFAFAIMRLT